MVTSEVDGRKGQVKSVVVFQRAKKSVFVWPQKVGILANLFASEKLTSKPWLEGDIEPIFRNEGFDCNLTLF
jgi:hypothetical protein